MKKIIKKYELILTEVTSNNNKFWRGLLYDDGTGASEYGRVGYNAQTCDYPSHSVVEKKMNEKLRKGYTEVKTVENVDNVNINKSNSKPINNSELHNIAKSQLLKKSNPVLESLIKRFVDANVHKITQDTQITYNNKTGLFSTPLGIVTMDGLIEARNLLAELAPIVRNQNFGTSADKILSKYLRIIPQNVGMSRFNTQTLIPDDNALQKQMDLIDSLESSYQAITTNPTKPSDSSNKSVEEVFKVDLDVLNNKRERSRLEKYFEDSKKRMHGYDNIHISEIFEVNIHEMTNNFETNTTPCVEVFHGTSVANTLSILKSGLKISPPSTVAIAGKMMGNGIYGAINSSKSMGYTFGRWGQGSSKYGYLFICDFAMGKTQIVYNAKYNGADKGYDSIWAKAGQALHNDELVVYRNTQAKIKYLLEVK